MKYYDTILEEQETSINIAYDLEVIQVYTNRVDVIKNLSKEIGKPNIRDKKEKLIGWEQHGKFHLKIFQQFPALSDFL